MDIHKEMIDEHIKHSMKLMNDITPESAGAFIKRGLEEDFVELAKEANDQNLFVAHVCMLHLATHLITRNIEEKMTPKEALEKTLKQYPNSNENMVKTLVSQFSIRGDEFANWVENPTKWETLWELEK